mgnify:CR=1 FL=1
METNTQLNPLHPRTSGGCIASGYRLYTSVFRRLFRASWPVAVVYAVAMAAMMSYYISHAIPLMGLQTIVDPETMHHMWLTTMIISGLLGLCFLIVATVLASYGFSAMREHLASGEVSRPAHWWGRMDRKTFLRTAVSVGWLILFSIIFSALTTGLSMLATRTGLTSLMIGVGVFALALLFLLLPLCYTVYRAILSKRFSPAPPLRGYLSGLGHWGLLFVVVLITGLATLLLTLITQLPAVILYAANIQSQLGALQGDDLGMPQGMWWLNFVVFFLGGFIQAYVHLSTLFPLYYAYGTIRNGKSEQLLNVD